MVYVECRSQDCSFLVTQQDSYCPNCGIAKPHLQVSEDYLKSVAYNPGNHGCFFVIVFCIVLFTIELILLSASKGFQNNFGVLVLLMFVITTAAFFGGLKILKWGYGVPSDPNVRHTPNLQHSEEIIRQRLREIEKREARINELISRVRKNSGQHWQSVLKVIEDAAATLVRQGTRYRLKLREINLLRWQNRVMPLITEVNNRSQKEVEERLQALEKEQRNGADVVTSLKCFPSSEVTDSVTRVYEVLSACDRVHQSLAKQKEVFLIQEVLAAVKEASPLADGLRSIQAPIKTNGNLEAINYDVVASTINADLNVSDATVEFAASLSELESEYNRLQDEEDIMQDLNRIIEKA